MAGQGSPATPSEVRRFFELVDNNVHPIEAAEEVGRGRSWAFDRLAQRRAQFQNNPPMVNRLSDELEKPLLDLRTQMTQAYTCLATFTDDHSNKDLNSAHKDVLDAFEKLFISLASYNDSLLAAGEWIDVPSRGDCDLVLGDELKYLAHIIGGRLAVRGD